MKRAACALVLGLALVVAGCRHKDGGGVAADGPVPIALNDSSTGLLLTWIDERGDFHVEQSPADVPIIGRDAVRVVDPSREEGTHDDRIFLADLRLPRPDGSYPVKAVARAEFDAIAGGRRAKTGPTLASAAPPANDTPPSPLGPYADSPPADVKPSTHPVVIIYGADWCGACHDAAAYLRRKGVAFVEKNVERDKDAAREMNIKLSRNGLRGGSIPVLDVKGKIMVGFNPQSVDDALGKAI